MRFALDCYCARTVCLHVRSKYQAEFGSDVTITEQTTKSILALQGPKVSAVDLATSCSHLVSRYLAQAAAVLGRFLDGEVSSVPILWTGRAHLHAFPLDRPIWASSGS